MRRVSVINQKGGVGKTTTCVNHSAALARHGKRVLLLDLDPQANLTLHLDRQPEEGAKTLTDLLIDGVPLREMISETTTPNLFLVPSDTSLAGVEQILANRIGRETILREALDELADLKFDFVMMDCPPSLGVLSANALVASEEVLIPLQTEYFALQGMAKLMEVIELVQRRLNPELRINSLLPCMVDQRTRLSSEVLAEIGNHFGELLAKSMIRMNVKLAEAPSFGRTIFEHAPESNGALDHESFAREFLGLEPLEEEEEEFEDDEEEDGEEFEDDVDEEEEDDEEERIEFEVDDDHAFDEDPVTEPEPVVAPQVETTTVANRQGDAKSPPPSQDGPPPPIATCGE